MSRYIDADKLIDDIRPFAEYDSNRRNKDWVRRFEIAIDAQPKRTIKRTETHACDCISRQAAIDSFFELDVEIRPSVINAIIDMIRTLPPAETPKRTGKSAQNVPNDDLIFRKAAIDAVDATWWNARGIRKTIQELPSAQQWIPCSERLPEESGDYLITVAHHSGELLVEVDQFDNENGSWWHYMDDVIAWMPLPESYKGEKS